MRPTRSFAALAIGTALLLAAACGKEQPSLGGRADTARGHRGCCRPASWPTSPTRTRRNSRSSTPVRTVWWRPFRSAPAREGCGLRPTARPYSWRSAARPSARRPCRTRSARSSKADKSKDGIAVVDVATQEGDPGAPGRLRPGDVRHQPGRVYPVRLQRGCPHRIDRGHRQRKGPVHGGGGKGAGRGPAPARWRGGLGHRRDRSQPDAHRHQDRQGRGADQRRESGPATWRSPPTAAGPT